MSTTKNQAPPTENPPPHPTPKTAPTTGTAAQQTDDVLLDAAVSNVAVDDVGIVDAAEDEPPPLQNQSLKDALTGGSTKMTDNLEGGPTGLPKDAKAFSIGFRIVTQVVSLLVGFRTFMIAVKRPQEAALVPGAATALTTNWLLLKRLMPGALADIRIDFITALLARLRFVQTLLQRVGTLNTRLLAVQSHIEDQLISQLRPVYDRCEPLLVSHDDLMDPMNPLVRLFTFSAQKAQAARQNNLKAGDKAVAAATPDPTPAAPGTTPPPGIVVPPGTVVSPGTVVPPGTVVQQGTVGLPVRAPVQQPAPKKGRPRG